MSSYCKCLLKSGRKGRRQRTDEHKTHVLKVKRGMKNNTLPVA